MRTLLWMFHICSLLMACQCGADGLDPANANKTKSALNSPRIFDGTAGRQGQFKSLVYLITSERSSCTGSIISSHFVLTAAHCVSDLVQAPTDTFNPHTVTLITGVVPGPARFQNFADTGRVQKRVVDRKHIFLRDGTVPEVDLTCVVMLCRMLANKIDLALVRSNEPFLLNAFLQPMALLGEKIPDAFETDKCIAVGYGQPVVEDQSRLMFVNAKAGGNDFCHSKIDWSTFPDTDARILKSVFLKSVCTTGKHRQQVCVGDSGGPLIWQVNGKEVAIGVSSMVIGYGTYEDLKKNDCGQVLRMALYVNLGASREWIERTTQDDTIKFLTMKGIFAEPTARRPADTDSLPKEPASRQESSSGGVLSRSDVVSTLLGISVFLLFT